MAITQGVPSVLNGQNGAAAKKPLIHEPLKLAGHLDDHKSFKVTPIIGTEFPNAHVAEWLQAPNSDELIRELAIISRHPIRDSLTTETVDGQGQSLSEALCFSGPKPT